LSRGRSVHVGAAGGIVRQRLSRGAVVGPPDRGQRRGRHSRAGGARPERHAGGAPAAAGAGPCDILSRRRPAAPERDGPPEPGPGRAEALVGPRDRSLPRAVQRRPAPHPGSPPGGGASLEQLVTQLAEWLSGGSPAQLFLHGQTHADRALVLARPQDIVCVPDEVGRAYLSSLSDLGRGPHRGHVVAASRFGAPGVHGTAERPLWARFANSADALRALAELLRRNGVTRLHPYAAS